MVVSLFLSVNLTAFGWEITYLVEPWPINRNYCQEIRLAGGWCEKGWALEERADCWADCSQLILCNLPWDACNILPLLRRPECHLYFVENPLISQNIEWMICDYVIVLKSWTVDAAYLSISISFQHGVNQHRDEPSRVILDIICLFLFTTYCYLHADLGHKSSI